MHDWLMNIILIFNKLYFIINEASMSCLNVQEIYSMF